MNILQLLGTVPPEDLGVPSAAIPPFATTRIPMAMLKPQLSSGQVFLNVSDVIVGCSPEHRAAMAGCRPGLRIKVPISLIFPNVRASQAPAPLPNPFGKAAGGPVAVDQGARNACFETVRGSGLADQGGVSIADHSSTQGFEPPAETMAASEPELAAGADAETGLLGNFGSPLAALSPLGASQPEPRETESSAGSSLYAGTSLPPLMPAGGRIGADVAGTHVAIPPAPEQPAAGFAEESASAGAWPFAGSEHYESPRIDDVFESLEDLPPLNGDGGASVPQGFANFGDSPSDRQATLRGLFLEEGEVDATRVAEHCSELPGIESCALLGAAGLLSRGSLESEPFGSEASRLHACLLDLMAVAGASESECFTIRTDRKMVSFFCGDGLAIAVRHGAEGFRPGVRERLEIIARELGNLSAERQ